MMKMYVVMINDRHHDPEPEVFTSAAAAVVFAREIARDWLIEEDPIPSSNWLYLAVHESESDLVWVIEKEVRS